MNDLLEYNIDDFIALKRKHNGITLKDVYSYAEDHYDQLQKINSIFKLETEEHIRCCMTLPRILKPEWAEEIITYVQSEKFNKVKLTRVPEPELSEYSLLLISAFYYNPQFLKDAWDWCVINYFEAKEEKERAKGNKREEKRKPWEIIFEPKSRIATEDSHKAATGNDLELFSWSCSQGKLSCYDQEDGKIEYRFFFNDPQEHEKHKMLMLSITKEKTHLLNLKLSAANEGRYFRSSHISSIDPDVTIAINSIQNENHD